ncbi:MAG: arginine deiminase family protein [Meiothermus sp.]|nr:arginine deiminase family protein [Meiothermus sp.]
MQNYGVGNMIAPLKRVMVVAPKPFPGEVTWQEFNYFRAPDEARVQTEHAAFRGILQAAGCEVVTVEDYDPRLQDGLFTHDPSIMTPWGAVVTRMGKALRLGENDLHAQTYERLGIPILGRIEAPGTLEGGDTTWLDERTLVVGRGFRTNLEGVFQLEGLLKPHGITVTAVDLPYFNGRKECLHLMSLINLLDRDLAAVFERFMPVALMEALEERGIGWIAMPEEEFYSLGNNLLTLAPRLILMAEGNPKSRALLEAAGCQVLTYSGEEISKNREGGPTCLTRPLWRAW